MKKRRKIFQRAAALLCCIFLLPSLVAVPALAADDMNNFIDLVDAGYFETIYKLSPTENRIEIPFGDYTLLKYIDFVFSRSSKAPDRIYLVSGYDGSRQQLYCDSIGNNMYRAYETIKIHSSTRYFLEFETTGTTYIYPYSCKISLNTGSSFPDIGRLMVSDYLGELTDWGMDSPTSPLSVYFRYPSVLDNGYTLEYQTGVYIDNWRKYDYIDVQLTLADSSVSSIACSMDGSFVPFDISVVGDVELFDFAANETGGVIRYFTSGLDNYMYVNLRLDLTNLYRSSRSDLGIMISGQYSSDMSHITLYSVTGHVSKDTSDTDTLWIKMKKFFTDLFLGDEDFQEEVDQSITEFEDVETDINEGIDSLETPEVEDVDIVSIINASGADSSTLKDFFAAAFNNVVVNWLMILSFGFMLISFLLYGSFR